MIHLYLYFHDASRASIAGNYSQKVIYDYLIRSRRVTEGNLFSERYANARENVRVAFYCVTQSR